MKVLNQAQIQQVSAGHGEEGLLLYLAIPHIIIGIIEFTNYFGNRIANGCDNIEEDDYFAKGMCAVYQFAYNGVSGVYQTITGNTQ